MVFNWLSRWVRTMYVNLYGVCWLIVAVFFSVTFKWFNHPTVNNDRLHWWHQIEISQSLFWSTPRHTHAHQHCIEFHVIWFCDQVAVAFVVVASLMLFASWFNDIYYRTCDRISNTTFNIHFFSLSFFVVRLLSISLDFFCTYSSKWIF